MPQPRRLSGHDRLMVKLCPRHNRRLLTHDGRLTTPRFRNGRPMKIKGGLSERLTEFASDFG